MCLQEVELERQCNKAYKILTNMKIQEQRGRKVQAIQCKALTQGNNKRELHVWIIKHEGMLLTLKNPNFVVWCAYVNLELVIVIVNHRPHVILNLSKC